MRSPILALLIALTAALTACGDTDRLESRDHRFVAVQAREPGSVVVISVEDGYGHVLFAPGTRFTEPVVLTWDGAQRLWIHAAGGTDVWAPHDVGGAWAPLTSGERTGLIAP